MVCVLYQEMTLIHSSLLPIYFKAEHQCVPPLGHAPICHFVPQSIARRKTGQLLQLLFFILFSLRSTHATIGLICLWFLWRFCLLLRLSSIVRAGTCFLSSQTLPPWLLCKHTGRLLLASLCGSFAEPRCSESSVTLLSAKLHYTDTPTTDMLYNTTNEQAHN